ncbi:hypothetical protein ACI49Z_003777 [Cronobacter turicensis]|uniref:hypothetical protein n=1 Tax=Cronobacter turicensis TaxID=413502 RepID=UPI0024ACF048|nr:hypothetical protein [Cronobacter turicensis]ELY6322373.1 hypothetical protein [Cronobacter turicensis]MDI6434226.1 hypothetical protein [Cronobacter turicensis]
MADVVSVNAVVKEAVQQVSVWVPLLSGLGGVAITGFVSFFLARQNHRYTLDREEAGARERLRQAQLIEKEKRHKELIYISTELIILLEQYAEGCAAVAGDEGEMNNSVRDSEREPSVDYPAPLNFESVPGDWRSLPAVLMFRIRELPLLRTEAMGAIKDAGANSTPPDHSEYFSARQYEFSRLGLKAIHLARQLRRKCGLPRSRLNASPWLPQPVMLNVLRRERKQRRREPEENDFTL